MFRRIAVAQSLTTLLLIAAALLHDSPATAAVDWARIKMTGVSVGMSAAEALAAVRAAYGAANVRTAYAPCAPDAAAALRSGKSTVEPKCLVGISAATQPVTTHGTTVTLVERATTRRTYVVYIKYTQQYNTPADFDAFVATARSRFGPPTIVRDPDGPGQMWCDDQTVAPDATGTRTCGGAGYPLGANASNLASANPYLTMFNCASATGPSLQIIKTGASAIMTLTDLRPYCAAVTDYKAATTSVSGVKAAF